MNGVFHSLTTEFEICEPSQVSYLRRKALDLARVMGMVEDRRAELALALTEAASNLLHHAEEGSIFLNQTWLGDHGCLDVLALDRGPGIRDLGAALAGGRSTRGGLGEGLSAIHRLADDFEICTSRAGTALLSRFWTRPPTSAKPWFPVAINRPKVGESASGDGWAARELPSGELLLMVLDGLGHGPEAARVAQRGQSYLERSSDEKIDRLLAGLHSELKSTRGAAAMLLRISQENLKVVSIGNVQGTILNGSGRRTLMGFGGIVGYGSIQIREFDYEFSPGAFLVVHTDGIESNWDLSQHPGLLERDPALIAGVLHRDHRRDDDALALVLRSGKAR